MLDGASSTTTYQTGDGGTVHITRSGGTHRQVMGTVHFGVIGSRDTADIWPDNPAFLCPCPAVYRT
jgi:hypothetical protein